VIQQLVRQRSVPRPLIRLILLIALCGTILPSPAAFAVQFADDTFDLTNYAPPLLYVNPAGPATVVPQQITTGGNPGPALQILCDFPLMSSPLETFIGFIRPSFSYDPALSGPIERLAISADKYTTVNVPAVPNTSLRPLILQNGKYYMSVISVFALENTYQTISNPDLGPADFNLFDFATGTIDAAQHPNFTAGNMQFGFTSRSGANFSTGVDIHADLRFDNLLIEVVPIPEPATISLIVLSTCGCIGLRRPPARAK